MSRRTKITVIERIKSRTLRVALKVFMADPSLGKCQAKPLFAEIFSHLQAGMDEEQVVREVVRSHAMGNPSRQLSLM
jgi:hypothetical protein